MVVSRVSLSIQLRFIRAAVDMFGCVVGFSHTGRAAVPGWREASIIQTELNLAKPSLPCPDRAVTEQANAFAHQLRSIAYTLPFA